MWNAINSGMWIIAAIVTVVIDRKTRRSNREMFALVERNARDNLDIMGHLRRTMEDLQRRDPQIAEMVEFQLAELDRKEPGFRALSRGDYTELRRLKRSGKL